MAIAGGYPTSLCVVAFPQLTDADMEWVRSVRATYDPDCEQIGPHITLVFPTYKPDLQMLGAAVQRSVQGQELIRVRLRYTMPFRGPYAQKTHLFLVPDEGFSSLSRLHNRLSHELGFPQNVDVPFIPHMTVGVFANEQECRQVADRMNAMPFDISACIKSISIVAGTGVAEIYETIRFSGVDQVGMTC